MTDKEILNTMAVMLEANNKTLMIAVDKSITSVVQESEKRIKQELTQLFRNELAEAKLELTQLFRSELAGVKQELLEKIKAAQEDTIEALSVLIHTGYNYHEARIQRVEDELHLPPLKHK